MTQRVWRKCTKKYTFLIFSIWGLIAITFYYNSHAISSFMVPHLVNVVRMLNESQPIVYRSSNSALTESGKSLVFLTNTKPKHAQNTSKPISGKQTASVKHTTANKPAKPTTAKLSGEEVTLSSRFKQACLHPELDVHDPGMMKNFKKHSKIHCLGQDWVYVDNGTLHLSAKAVNTHKTIDCNYFSLIRKTEKLNSLGPPIRNIKFPFQILDDAFKVVCIGEDGQIYENFHQGVAYRKEYVERKQEPLTEGLQGMGIAVLGIDAMSRMSWLRRLPITHKYFVEKLGAIDLEQHNIVGDGTTAVMLPMLTGKFEWELPECRQHHKGAKPLDDFPWIWNEFKKAGYLTSWSNARPRSAPFNWRMLGFEKPPTDFYSRTFYVSAETKYKGLCLGSQHLMDIWLNWNRDMFHMYNYQRKFLFNHIIDFSHNDNNIATALDVPLQKLVQHLHDDGYLNNTLLILMGDHGFRHGRVRFIFTGKLEIRKPYFSLLFPPWFQKKYPEAIKNLKTNAKRLTTPFDLYETFKDFLKFTGTGKGNLKHRGISLFKEIPLERTCKHADIASHWCACMERKTTTIDSKTQAALKTALDAINGYTKDYRSLCAELSITNVSSSTKMEMGNDFLKFKKTDAVGGIYDINFSLNNINEKGLYQFVFTTNPGNGQFEVAVIHEYKGNKYTVNEKEIYRINKYKDASHCIVDKNPRLQPYCYCKDLS